MNLTQQQLDLLKRNGARVRGESPPAPLPWQPPPPTPAMDGALADIAADAKLAARAAFAASNQMKAAVEAMLAHLRAAAVPAKPPASYKFVFHRGPTGVIESVDATPVAAIQKKG